MSQPIEITPALLADMRKKAEAATQGPWRWEFNEKSQRLELVGGKTAYDLTVIDFVRWGMSGATARFRDLSNAGMNIMHKLHERRDWIAPIKGREHHADWCADVVHPDAAHIATFNPAVVLALVAEIERLRAVEGELTAAYMMGVEDAKSRKTSC